MPEGSSSAAPVMTPGPRAEKKRLKNDGDFLPADVADALGDCSPGEESLGEEAIGDRQSRIRARDLGRLSSRKIVVVRRILLVAGALVFTGAAYVVFSIGPRNLLGMIRYDQRSEGRLRVGDRAPDVELVALDGTGRVRLRDFVGGQPLVLVFGSYT